MPDPIRLRIIAGIGELLANIRRVNGYDTDAGEAVAVGHVPLVGDSDPDTVLAMTLGRDSVRSSLQRKSIELPVEVHVLARVDRDTPWVRCELARADVLRAFESADRRLQGLAADQIRYGGTETREREPGSLDIGLTITYFVPYTEAWGNPRSI